MTTCTKGQDCGRSVAGWLRDEVYFCAGIPFGSLFTGESGSKHCRRRKARTVFSDQQLTGLEKRFEAQRYLSTPERVELATALSLSETQVPNIQIQNIFISFQILQCILLKLFNKT